jgi:hypothetical protein
MSLRTQPFLAALVIVGAALVALLAWQGRLLYLRWMIAAELQPVALSNCTLTRVGSAGDGGYLMCDRLPNAIDSAYSYGVGHNDDWGCQVSRQFGVTVHQYDCFNPARPSCAGGTFLFHNECVAARAETSDGRLFDTLENQIRRNGDNGRRVFLKIDIEAAEWDAILATPDAVFAAIPQLAMELHGYNEPKILDALRKLKRHFYLVNLNYNNWSCTRRAWPVKAWAYQVLFVNKSLGTLDPSAPVPAPPSPLNALDAPQLPPCR